MIRPGTFIAAVTAAAITYQVTRAHRACSAPVTAPSPDTNTMAAIADATRKAVAVSRGEDTTGMRPDGLPAEHPESMDLELAPADEVWLAMISDTLWPCDEYQQIVAEDYRQRRDGAA
jgi:hypothetical protein